jgi:hypothetical protein
MAKVISYSRNGEGKIKENDGRDKFNIYCKHFCVNFTVYPSTTMVIKKEYLSPYVVEWKHILCYVNMRLLNNNED